MQLLLHHAPGHDHPDKAYVFLQLWIPPNMRGDDETYRAKRQQILRIACGMAKNRYPNLQTVVGIGIPPPKFEREIGEDLVWLDCTVWPSEMRAEFESLNVGWNFFETGVRHEKKIREFLLPQNPSDQPKSVGKNKIGRNEQCHCGSGKKFKKCHGS